MKKAYLVANWKMNTTPSTAAKITKQFLSCSHQSARVTTILCPSYTGISAVREALHSHSRKDVVVGAQNCFWEEHGAYTGEESLSSLYVSGCRAVIVGHSERRQHMGEIDVMVGKKIKAILDYKKTIIPILCIGESLQEKKNNSTVLVLRKQLVSALTAIHALSRELIIAYEPIWAIGTGIPIQSSDCAKASQTIRSILMNRLDPESEKYIRVLYGGSVTIQNTSDIMQNGAVDGLLVGSASLEPKNISTIQEIMSHLV